MCFLPIYNSPSFHFRLKGFRREVINPQNLRQLYFFYTGIVQTEVQTTNDLHEYN